MNTQTQDQYQPGAILESSWGYDQTNIDYFKIVKRTKNNIFLVPLHSKIVEAGDMRGTCQPGSEMQPGEFVSCIGDWNGKPIRRKLCFRGETPIGCSIKHGWCDIFNGGVSHFTSYA